VAENNSRNSDGPIFLPAALDFKVGWLTAQSTGKQTPYPFQYQRRPASKSWKSAAAKTRQPIPRYCSSVPPRQ
jgi:hypothetical protein